MRKILVLGIALALVSGVAYANYCARDVVPAATLLLPYAVVDLNADGTPNTAGYTTLFAVTNVSSDRVLVHFTAWSAKSNPVVDWDEILTGYDVWTINLRDLLTGHFDYFDTGSQLKPTPSGGPPPFGPSSNNAGVNPTLTPAVDAPATVPAGCNFPYGPRLSLGPIITSKLQTDITAQPLQDVADCKTGVPQFPSPPWLIGLTDNPVFFYVTADVVAACNTAFPNETGYWTGTGGRYPAAKNVLIGDVIIVNSTTGFSESTPAVHIEADPAYRNANFTAYYDRYSHTFGVEDDREPLATAFAFRYINAGATSTQAMVWKDSDESDAIDPGIVQACKPYVYYAWDENEHALARGGGGPSGFDIAEPNVIPFETQSAPVNSANWDGIPATSGWILIVFDYIAPSSETVGHQAWIGVRYLSGGYSTSLEAATIGNYNCFSNQVLRRLGINVAGVGTFPSTSVYLP